MNCAFFQISLLGKYQRAKYLKKYRHFAENSALEEIVNSIKPSIQCNNFTVFFRFRYVYSIRADVRQGYFEEDEDHILLVGAKLFGHDWARISHFIPSRTPMQIHSRFNTFLKANFENWTQEEDLQLLEKVKEKGTKDWKQIANEFQSRTRSQCRQRFYYIHKVC